MNNSQEIILAQISAIYDKPPFVKVKTGQMEMILKCVGLGKYYDEYAKYLEPYWYNRGFQNDMNMFEDFIGYQSSTVLDEPEREAGTTSIPIPQREESENIPLPDLPGQLENVQQSGNEIAKRGMPT